MRALRVDAPGGLCVVNTPIPVPQCGEVLVEVICSAINGMDTEVLDGQWSRHARRWAKCGPTLTGIEFSGIARSDGANIKAGQRVIGYSHVLKGARTHCQFVSMPERDLYPFSESLSFEEAAALVVCGLTSLQVLERIRPLHSGQRCLVIGANGGVGAHCVQLASSQGAQVTALAAKKHAGELKAMGAHEVLDGRDHSVWSSLRDFDLIVDTPPLLRYVQAKPLLARGGTYVSTHPEQDLFALVRSCFSSRKTAWLMLLRGNPELFERLVSLAEQSVLHPLIDSVFGLSRAEDAFARVRQSGRLGRVLLRMDQL